MPVAKVEAALELEVINWRMGACGTMAVEVDVGAGAGTGAGRADWAGFAEENRKNGFFQNVTRSVTAKWCKSIVFCEKWSWQLKTIPTCNGQKIGKHLLQLTCRQIQSYAHTCLQET